MDNPLGQELEQAQLIYNQIVQFLVDYSMQVVGAIIILVAGFFVARAVSRWVVNFMLARNLDVTISEMTGSFVYFGIFFCFLVIALGKFGISITPFVAALGAFSLGAGLAIQGIVGNYGAGLSIIFARPFVVGNTLTVQGVSGVVHEIRLAYTTLITEDGEHITIPNREIIGQILENSFENKLVETIVTIDPEANPNDAVAAIRGRLTGVDCIASEPALQLGIDEFRSHGISLGVRCWVPTVSYFDAKYQVNKEIYDTLKSSGIALAVPRHSVQLLTDS